MRSMAHQPPSAVVTLKMAALREQSYGAYCIPVRYLKTDKLSLQCRPQHIMVACSSVHICLLVFYKTIMIHDMSQQPMLNGRVRHQLQHDRVDVLHVNLFHTIMFMIHPSATPS